MQNSKYRKIIKRIKIAISYIIGYCIIIPVAFLMPKKKNVVLIPRYGDFEGNLKYLYLCLNNLKLNGIEVTLLTRKKEVYRQLKESGLKVWLFPGFKTVIRMLRTGLIVVDSNGWYYDYFYYLLYWAKKVQVWHGTGIKSILLLRTENEIESKLKNILSRQNIYYDIVNFTSDYQLETRGKAFRFGESCINGLPRNDIFFNDKLWKDSYGKHSFMEKLLQKKERGTKIITYAPTWRYELNSFEQFNLAAFNDYAIRNNLVLLIKLHVKDNYNLSLSEYSNIVDLDKHDDIYPFLVITDLLVTDYSSIYFDFLLTDRPIVFYPYDRDEYINKQKELLADYDLVTPGPKCYSQSELEQVIYEFMVQGYDQYKANRREIRDKYFYYQDGKSSERLWECIKQLL